MLKNILNTKIGLSLRCKGEVIDNKIEDYKIISYDLVSQPSMNFNEINEIHSQILKELNRQKLIEERKKKIKKLNDTRRKI